jgi:hypothetical protein
MATRTNQHILDIRAGFRSLRETQPLFRERVWSCFYSAHKNPFADEIKAANEAMWAAERAIVAACAAARDAGVDERSVGRALSRGMKGVTHCSRILKNEVELYAALTR